MKSAGNVKNKTDRFRSGSAIRKTANMKYNAQKIIDNFVR